MPADVIEQLRMLGNLLDAHAAPVTIDDIRRTELRGELEPESVGVIDTHLAGRPEPGYRWTKEVLAVAAIVVVVVGLAIVGLQDHATKGPSLSVSPTLEGSTPEPTAIPMSTLPTPSSTISPSTTISPDDPSLWNPIRIAPGTTGWYEFGDVPAALAPLVSDLQTWTPDYTASFYRCATYTVDADGPICTGLIGGNFVAPNAFGGTGELGTHLGDISTADLAWTMAQGSLWGYDEVTSPPPTTPVAVGDHAGAMYSNADTSYLVWEQAPGVHLWIRASGITTGDMVALALTVRPATLPDHLPLRIIVDTVATSGAPSYDELVIGSHPGMPRCAEISSNGCVSLPPVTEVAMVVGNNGVDGPLTAVAAIFPLGSANRLRVDLADADPITVEPVVSPLGFQYSIFRAGTERIIGGGAVAPDGSVVATATLSTVPTGPTPTTAGPRSQPGSIHPEEGVYVIASGDFPSTIAAKFKVRFADLLGINGWTLVGNQIPEFPPVGTTIKIPPDWTDPGPTTNSVTTTT